MSTPSMAMPWAMPLGSSSRSRSSSSGRRASACHAPLGWSRWATARSGWQHERQGGLSMPNPFTYTKDQVVTLRVRVLDAHDAGAVIVRLGSVEIPLNSRDLDAADTRPQSQRPLTPEEQDMRELREEDTSLKKERQAEADRVKRMGQAQAAKDR